MEHSEPHLLLFDGALAAEVVLASVEEGERASAAVVGGEIELMEARMSHGPILAEVGKLWRARMEELLLDVLDAGQAVGDGVQGLHLLQESHHQLVDLLIFCEVPLEEEFALSSLGSSVFFRSSPMVTGDRCRRQRWGETEENRGSSGGGVGKAGRVAGELVV
jgi:hypothetical protein